MQVKESNPGFAFSTRLAEVLLANLTNTYGSENWDSHRFGKRRKRVRRRLFEMVSHSANHLFDRVGIRLVATTDAAYKYSDLMRTHGEGIGELYAMLHDVPSRAMLVDVIAYRLLGYTRVKLTTNGPERLEKRREAERLMARHDTIDSGFRGQKLLRFALAVAGYPLTLYSRPGAVVRTFVDSSYVYAGTTPPIGVASGDYVVDAGGAWGDTALRFACDVGADGRVFSFEFEPTNLRVMARNLELNPQLNGRIEVVRRALWRASDQSLSFVSDGPGTHIANGGSTSSHQSVTTITLDDFCRHMPRVDFIKMDIEGAELPALEGARETLIRHRPKLAIALYHSLDDFVQIPRFLSDLNLDYTYYLDHTTIHHEETVLFAAPGKR
jgi:FkbM family methyltransferase